MQSQLVVFDHLRRKVEVLDMGSPAGLSRIEDLQRDLELITTSSEVTPVRST